jgi:hypothetical protein
MWFLENEPSHGVDAGIRSFQVFELLDKKPDMTYTSRNGVTQGPEQV